MKKRKERAEDDGSYVVPQNRKMNVFAFVICFLVALLIWIYATNMENKEKTEEPQSTVAAEVVDTVDEWTL